MKKQKSNHDLMITIITITIGLIFSIITVEYNIIPKYYDLTFWEMLLMFIISALIIIMVALAFINRIKGPESVPRVGQGDIRDYIRSLHYNLENKVKQRSHNLFIGKLSESVTVKRWIGRLPDKKGTPLIDILNGDEPLVAIRGTGGTGKTFTLWNWIMESCNNIEKDFRSPQVLLHRILKLLHISSNKVKIPVYVPLRDLKEYKDIEKRIKEIIIAGDHINPFFDQLVKEGRIIFIFDGLNEISLDVAGDKRIHVEKTMRDLREYWRTLSNETTCKVVVTCRDIIPYLEEMTISEFFDENFFSVYWVMPLSHNDIEDILKSYLPNAPQFISQLKTRGEYDSVSDALRLSLAIEVFCEDNILPPPLPLYEKFILKSIEKNLRSVPDSPKRINHYISIAEILKDVAYNIIKDGQSGASFPKSVIENIVDSYKYKYPDVRVEHLIGCGFLEEDCGSFRFWQQHWNEVFAALKIKESNNLKSEIKEKITDERWYGTLIVLSRFLERSDDLIEIAIETKIFDLSAKIIKNASNKDNVNLIHRFLLDLTENLNEVRILTCWERNIDIKSSEKYDKILYTFFKVVEILDGIALKPFMDMCTKNEDSLIRAQGIYFIEAEKDLMEIMTNEHAKSLLEHLKKEDNIHVIFHILIVLEEFLQRKEIKNEIQQEIIDKLSGWNSLTQLQAKIILRRKKLLSPLTLEEKKDIASQFKTNIAEAKRLIDCLKTFEKKYPYDRKAEFNEILDNLEPRLWLVTELTIDELIESKNEATELLSYAINENTNPFWIVRWWAIFNLGKIGTNNANQLLFDNIKDQLLDIGLLCIKRLSVSTGGDEYIRNFCSWAKEPTNAKKVEKLSIRLREAEHALEMHN